MGYSYYKIKSEKRDPLDDVYIRWFSREKLVAERHRDHTIMEMGYNPQTGVAVMMFEGGSQGRELLMVGDDIGVEKVKAFIEESGECKLERLCKG